MVFSERRWGAKEGPRESGVGIRQGEGLRRRRNKRRRKGVGGEGNKKGKKGEKEEKEEKEHEGGKGKGGSLSSTCLRGRGSGNSLRAVLGWGGGWNHPIIHRLSPSPFWLQLNQSTVSPFCFLKIFKKKKRKEKQFSVAYVITELMLFAFYWFGSHPSRSK